MKKKNDFYCKNLSSQQGEEDERCGLVRWRRVRRGEGGGAAFAGCGKVREARRRDRRGGEWSRADEVRCAGSSGAGEVSSNDLVRVILRVRVREWKAAWQDRKRG